MQSKGKIITSLKALRQLGFEQVWNYTKYRFGLWSGFYRFRTPPSSINRYLPKTAFSPTWFFNIPAHDILEKIDVDYRHKTLQRGDEIIFGNTRLFGGKPVPIKLRFEFPIAHWSFHETNKIAIPVEDIKFIWQPARFSWAIELGKAWQLTGEEKYVKAFFHNYQEFQSGNPLNLGPNWQSGQEIALRMMSLIVTLHFFRQSRQLKRGLMDDICRNIADHAERIFPTLSYAKAQNNNHLLSEAIGLYTAGIFLQDHPRAAKWKQIGRSLFRKAIIEQIGENGEYCQHSTNYHRMMLTLALWMRYLLTIEGDDFEEKEKTQLKKSVKWLIGQVDEISGRAANLGHNDGSLIFPFSSAEFADYRPILQAAGAAFLSEKLLLDGPWNDLAIWLVNAFDKLPQATSPLSSSWPETRIGEKDSWANIRAVTYKNRPAHADQLHVDLWIKGVNVLMDAGTYLYNAKTPWENALAATQVHNTVCVDSQDQMHRSGRFLWLDWAQAEVLQTEKSSVKARHTGYRRLGVDHQRELIRKSESSWAVIDKILPSEKSEKVRDILVHWLLPDCPFIIHQNSISLTTPAGKINLEFEIEGAFSDFQVNLIRAGEALMGDCHSPNYGWFSPTYGEKIPALSVAFTLKSQLPVEIITSFYWKKDQ